MSVKFREARVLDEADGVCRSALYEDVNVRKIANELLGQFGLTGTGG
jgi:hypothetical protein